MLWIALFGALGGLAGLTTAIRLIWIEPKVARRDEIGMLWTENRNLRAELDVRSKHAADTDRTLYGLQLQVLKCESEKDELATRVTALEAR
jgi:hypothetical protein